MRPLLSPPVMFTGILSVPLDKVAQMSTPSTPEGFRCLPGNIVALAGVPNGAIVRVEDRRREDVAGLVGRGGVRDLGSSAEEEGSKGSCELHGYRKMKKG